MPTPRQPRNTLDPNRLMQRVEDQSERLRESIEARIDDGHAALSERLDAAFARIDQRFDRVEASVRSGDMKSAELSSELQDLRRQVQDARDTAIVSANTQTREAARGAAEGAAAAVGPAVAPAVKKAVQAGARPQWIAVGGVVVMAVTGFIEKAPEWVRGLEGFWAFMKGLGK